jgi:hypothetical protein
MSNGVPVQSVRISTLVSPADPSDVMQWNSSGATSAYPSGYGVNLGPSLVFDPTGRVSPPG